ncbi:epimerase [Nocardioides ferulae]|uniref:epimerase n=1 Tax=Nocardioides ferulae TaxID=2340821 RepID=UPI000EAC76B8|nr:epimerase [Nocardioides ferulae]
MRLLVLGGSVFLSREVAAEALRRGHQVACLCRSGDRVPEGARHVAVDRSTAAPAELVAAAGPEYDAVVDVGRQPSWVRRATEAWPEPHWVFVSSISVYADETTSGGGPGHTPLHEPVFEDVDLRTQPEAYGPMKVACERTVLDGTGSALALRPGLIVGPGDPTGRFTYWVDRLADLDHPDVLAPGDPDDTVQVVDVRDLAAWIVDCAEQRRTGVLDAIGDVTGLRELLAAVAVGVSEPAAPAPTLTWVPQELLEAEEVAPWAGPRSLPLWLPRPAYDGMLAHDPGPARDAGLRCRPVADTARDTLAWLRATSEATLTGLTRAEEAEVLAAWRGRWDRPARPRTTLRG